jgi:hypothetical protein
VRQSPATSATATGHGRRNPSRPPYRGDPTVSRCLRLGRRKYSATSFVQMLRQSGEPLSNRIMIDHHRNMRQPQPSGNPSSSENSKPIQLFPDEPQGSCVTRIAGPNGDAQFNQYEHYGSNRGAVMFGLENKDFLV